MVVKQLTAWPATSPCPTPFPFLSHLTLSILGLVRFGSVWDLAEGSGNKKEKKLLRKQKQKQNKNGGGNIQTHQSSPPQH
uniref:Uncharacterized protein n=1 Tax=Rhizophora mucronata TaxID=61149 RepID=A0A2P2KPF5_RHIMU